ncbi:MAG: ATP synthase F0 subunit C [Streptococcaceae bacterium]|jgi:F-type H+-transporting ATPase subunit c|nr:ATP synthase F0 subunit C [Streptococcaceae bacterium]
MNTLGIGMGLLVGLSVIGAAIGNAIVIMATMKSIARQPELSGRLSSLMFIGLGAIDGVAIIAIMIIGIMLLNKLS